MSKLEEVLDVPHPGEFIRDELEARDWSQRDLAFILGVPEQSINTILAGRRGISSEMAKSLGEAFDVAPEFFANLQTAFDMSKAREPDPGVAKRARLQDAYPIREMIRRGWLVDSDAALLEAQMIAFFKVADIDGVPHLAHAAKKTSYDAVPAAQTAWLFRVRQLAEQMVVPKYSQKKMVEALPGLHRLTTAPDEARHVSRLLTEVGVRFLIVEALPSAGIDGVCFWIGESPVIGLTTRYDRIDNFWFVLRHEIEHVLQRHGRDKAILDDLDGERGGTGASVPEAERIANAAAADFCIPREDMRSFIARKNPFFAERDVIAFAARMQVHPGLVVGQIQNFTKRWDLLRKHLVKVRQFALSGAIVDGWGTTAPASL